MLRIKTSMLSIVLMLILILSSCSNAGTGTSTSVATAISTDMLTTVSQSTPLPVPMQTKSIPTQLPPLKIKTQCVGNSKETSKLDLSGVVALDKAAKLDDFEFGFFLLDLKNGNIIRNVDDSVFRYVSPDRKYLAYNYVKGDIGFLSVLDSNGKTITDFEFRFDGLIWDYFNWQNSEQLRILHEEMGKELLVQLLNPFTQERTPLRTDWNGAYAPEDPFQDKLVQWKFDLSATNFFSVYGANVLYDPSLTRVLYPKDNGVVSLVDVGSEAELASAQFEDWGKLPSWSPDGRYLSIVNHEGNADEFYVISREGEEFQKITNFSEELKLASISEFEWSPDSKQIAFWLNTEAGEQESGAQSELAILDVATRQVTRLCIQGISIYAAKPWIMGHPEPTWSPDGRYLMITQWDDPASPKNYYVLVVDPLSGAVEKISKNTAPIGWMVSEP